MSKINTHIKLGVNIDHVATLRQARLTDYPDPVEAGMIVEAAGADSITVHLREDRRHIQENDVRVLLEKLSIPLNLEMALIPEMVTFAELMTPVYCCLVPEKRQELTTEGGLDVQSMLEDTSEACQRLKDKGIKVSLFIDPDNQQIEASKEVGAQMIEIHTGTYADAENDDDKKQELERIINAAQYAEECGLQVNAGHGLTLENVTPILKIPQLVELNIGHSIVSRAVFIGLENAVKEMRQAIDQGRQSLVKDL